MELPTPKSNYKETGLNPEITAIVAFAVLMICTMVVFGIIIYQLVQ